MAYAVHPYGEALSADTNHLPGVALNNVAALKSAVASVAVPAVVAVGLPPVKPAMERDTVQVASPEPL